MNLKNILERIENLFKKEELTSISYLPGRHKFGTNIISNATFINPIPHEKIYSLPWEQAEKIITTKGNIIDPPDATKLIIEHSYYLY